MIKMSSKEGRKKLETKGIKEEDIHGIIKKSRKST